MPLIDLPTGARLETLDTGGDGVPLVALHGMAGTARLHLRGVIAGLRSDRRVIGPSLRGYGGSHPKPRTFPPDFYHQDAADVIALLDALDIDRADLIGFSDGGEVALLAAATAPERWRRVAVWGAVGYYGPQLRETITAPGYKARLMPTPTVMMKHGITDAEAFADAWIAAVLDIIDAGGDLSLGVAARITAPLLMMLGTADTLNPAAYAERLLARVPEGRLQTFATGHAIHDDAPDEFLAALAAFLRG